MVNMEKEKYTRSNIGIAIAIISFMCVLMVPLMIGPDGMLVYDNGALRYILMGILSALSFISFRIAVMGR